MSKSHQSPAPFESGMDEGDGEEQAMFDPAEAAEEVPSDPDAHMDSDQSEGEVHGDDEDTHEITLHNDSVAYFDSHRDSIFCIAQHPIHSELIATGGGDDIAYIFDSTPPERPVLPVSYQSDPEAMKRRSLAPLARLEGHTDSVNAIAFSLPKGDYVLSAGLDGRLRAYRDNSNNGSGRSWAFVGEAQEVQEINWLWPCPHPEHANVVALGANDGSVWVYTINADDQASPLTITQAYYLHTESCTAGAWSPDGKLLASVSEDGSLYIWDVFGEAAAASLASGQTVVGITAQDQRFAVEGGLYSVGISPTGTMAVVGGAGGHIRAISLPRMGTNTSTGRGTNAKGKSGGAKTSSTSAAQAGQILASIQAQSDGIETLAFSTGPVSLLAAGSVDGSIALFDTTHQFAMRRHIQGAHGEFAVVKVEFVESGQGGGWLLTSAGMDGVVRRWDTRGGTTAVEQGLVKELKGHRGDGEGGGVLGFVQGGAGNRIVTAGDDGVSLVFEADHV